MQSWQIETGRWSRRVVGVLPGTLIGVIALACAWAVAPAAARADDAATFATVERAGPVAPPSAWTIEDAAAVASLEQELMSLPPSTAGFPKWLVHVFAGTERQRSYVVFAEDLARFPNVARAVKGELGSERALYRVELPGSYWQRSDEVVAKLEQLGAEPVFHAGARSNWPLVEVVLTERVEAGLPPVDAVAEDDDGKERARFMERVGPMLRNKTTDRTLDASYTRLTSQLYRHHRELTQTDEVSQFYTRFRRYRWRGQGGPRVAVRAEYRTPDAGSASAIDRYFEAQDSDPKTRLEPERYGIEVLSSERSPDKLRESLRAAFPDLVSVRPGRPLFE